MFEKVRFDPQRRLQNDFKSQLRRQSESTSMWRPERAYTGLRMKSGRTTAAIEFETCRGNRTEDSTRETIEEALNHSP